MPSSPRIEPVRRPAASKHTATMPKSAHTKPNFGVQTECDLVPNKRFQTWVGQRFGGTAATASRYPGLPVISSGCQTDCLTKERDPGALASSRPTLSDRY